MPKWTKKEDIERILRVARKVKSKRIPWRIRFKDYPVECLYPKTYLDRNCPVCNSTRKTFIAARHLEKPSSKGWYQLQHHDVKCDECDFHYSTNIPDADFMDDYYRHTVIRHGAVGICDGTNRIDIIERFVPKGGNILEYGSGSGDFVNLLLEAGYLAHGVDIDDDITDIPYDAICSYYTLEHLVYPNDVLRRFRGLLINKGVLIIEVPDYENYPDESFYFEHFNHFTRQYVHQMLMNNGFEHIEMPDAHSRYFGFTAIAVSE